MPESIAVLYRDDDLLVLDKPSGLPTTHPSDGDCLVARARRLDPSAPRLHASSRLDTQVTGVVTFARTGAAIERLLEARRRGLYRRGYLGLSARPPTPATGLWQGAIGVAGHDRRLRAVVAATARGAREARTRYRVLDVGDGVVALWLEPETGRTHQLRVHASAAGAALLGDRAYGGASHLACADGRTAAARRVMLHCARVELPARDGGTLRLQAPMPPDLLALWQAGGGAPLSLPD